MKKTLLIIFCLFGLFGYSQDEYYRIVDWKFYPDNVVQLTDSTYSTDATPFDYNDQGSIRRIVGNYVVDFVGHRYAVIDSTSTTITVLDIYHTGQAPQTGQVARCYRSVGNGEAEYVGSVDYSPLDESARWKLNGSDNELLWRHSTSIASNGLYKDRDTIKLGGSLTENTTIQTNDKSILIKGTGDNQNIGIEMNSSDGTSLNSYIDSKYFNSEVYSIGSSYTNFNLSHESFSIFSDSIPKWSNSSLKLTPSIIISATETKGKGIKILQDSVSIKTKFKTSNLSGFNLSSIQDTTGIKYHNIPKEYFQDSTLIPKYYVDNELLLKQNNLIITTAGTTGAATLSGDTLNIPQYTGGGGSVMVYPDAGIPRSTGTAWATSITDNSANWNTAYGWGNHSLSGYELASNKENTTVDNSITKYPTVNLLKTYAAPISGSGNYIQNQNTSAQSANIWIDGRIRNASQIIGANATSIPYLMRWGNATNEGWFDLDTGGAAIGSSTGYLQLYSVNGLALQLNTDKSATFASTIQATTAKLTNLTDGYLPYHISDASGLGNSPIYTDGTNVGIGITSPASTLHLSSTTSPYIILQTTNGAGKQWGIGVDNFYSNGLNFSEIGVADARIFIKDGGNVGIGYSTGTEIANNKLAVNGSGYFNGNMTINNAAPYYSIKSTQSTQNEYRLWSSYFSSNDLVLRNETDNINLLSFAKTTGVGTVYNLMNFNSTVNSTGYLLNNNNLFSSLSSGYLPYWDGAKLNNTPYFRESDLSLTNPYVSRSGGIRINGDVKVTTGEGLEMWYEASNMTSRIMAIDRGITNTFHPIELYGSNFYFSQGNVTVGNLSGTGTRLTTASADGTLGVISDGTNGQLLTTNGSGVYSFTTLSGLINPTVQTLSGTIPTWNVNSGIDANITLSGTTTITFSNLVAGMKGNLTVTNPATSYDITFSGYNFQIFRSVWKTGDTVYTSGSSLVDSYSWRYDGTYVIIGGSLGLK